MYAEVARCREAGVSGMYASDRVAHEHEVLRREAEDSSQSNATVRLLTHTTHFTLPHHQADA